MTEDKDNDFTPAAKQVWSFLSSSLLTVASILFSSYIFELVWNEGIVVLIHSLGGVATVLPFGACVSLFVGLVLFIALVLVFLRRAFAKNSVIVVNAAPPKDENE